MMLNMVNKPKKSNVYVIDLDLAVMNDRRFIEVNPNYIANSPCVYVGMTGRTPEIRFEQHKTNAKSKRGYSLSNKYVRRYGICLLREHFEHLNPMTHEQAIDMEVEVAMQLRKRGYGVWQN